MKTLQINSENRIHLIVGLLVSFVAGVAVSKLFAHRPVSLDLLRSPNEIVVVPVTSAIDRDPGALQNFPAPFYAPVSADVVFNQMADLGGITRPDLEYTTAEIVSRGPNRTIVRRTIALEDPSTKELLFGGTRATPVVFLFNLDHRIDRL
jgi:hypothetical protein